MEAHKPLPVRLDLHQLAGNALVIVSRVRTGLQRHGRLARLLSRPVHAFAPVYNEEDNLLVRTGVQRRGRLIYVASDAAVVFIVRLSRLVYINTPGHTFLHELFIEYEQVTAWVARISFNKLEVNYHILSTAVCTGWHIGQVHKSPPLQFG